MEQMEIYELKELEGLIGNNYIYNCIEAISLVDDSEYEPDLSHNGGKYRFVEKYKRIGGRQFVRICCTSADFDYCPVCGSFVDHYNVETDSFECGDFEKVDLEELMRRIKEHLGNDSQKHYVLINPKYDC